MLSGAYPSLRAANLEPVEAFPKIEIIRFRADISSPAGILRPTAKLAPKGRLAADFSDYAGCRMS